MAIALPSRRARSIVGLDIEPGYIAAVEVAGASGAVARAATAPLSPGLIRDGEVVDIDALAEALKEFFKQHEMGKRVRLGVANQRIVVRTLDLPRIEDRKELDAAIRFQAQEQVPMPLEQAVLDYHSLGVVQTDQGDRTRVVLVAARRDMIERLLAAARQAGLRPEGIDLSAFAMVRALSGGGAAAHAQAAGLPGLAPGGAPGPAEPAPGGEPDGPGEPVDRRASDADPELAAVGYATDPMGSGGPAPAPAAPAAFPAGASSSAPQSGGLADLSGTTLYVSVGGLTNVAVAEGSICRFTRIVSTGLESMAAGLAERRGLRLDHSHQWLTHVGLTAPTDAVPGDPAIVDDARAELADGTRRIADEVRASMDFYRSQELGFGVDQCVLTGSALQIPGFAARFAADLGIPVSTRVVAEARPGALAGVDAGAVTVAAGLAMEERAA
jgi:Tfp pilus assembly PilM family ATPase